METKNFIGTREFVSYSLRFVRGRTLDLGAGTAKYKPLIAARSESYVACDLFPGDHIDHVGDIVNTNLPGESFETIFCTQVFEHISTPWLAAKEIRRLLTPGGISIVTAPFLQSYHADPHDFFRYTKEGMRSLFENEHFDILEEGSYGKLFFVLADFVKMRFFNPYEKSRRGGSLCMAGLMRIAYFLDRFVKNKIIYANAYVIARKRP